LINNVKSRTHLLYSPTPLHFKILLSGISEKETETEAATFADALNEHKLTWYSKQIDLRDSAVTSTKRPISGGWGFGGDNSIPIEACSLAMWGVKTSKRNPSKSMRIG
jgi:hypothetical protein